MSELAPASPWKAMMFPGFALPALALAISPTPCLGPSGRVSYLPENDAKSVTCDVPPREPDAAIKYYWRCSGRATATSENSLLRDLYSNGQFQHGCRLRSEERRV